MFARSYRSFMITARIIADSINPSGSRITSWILKYPRFIHGEFMTHRVFSRNAASSRAIPFKKMLESAHEDMAMPEYWGAEKKGMQSGMSLCDDDVASCQRIWREALTLVTASANALTDFGLHKSVTNRIFEPWTHMTTMMTLTEHANFYSLRAHPMAQPEFQVLAFRMLDTWLKSTPVVTPWGGWHTPFGDKIDPALDWPTKLKVITARAARLSYLTFDGNSSVEEDLRLHDRLLAEDPKHASPAEHPAYAEESFWALINDKPIRTSLSVSGVDQANLRGWTSYRKTIARECVQESDVDYHAILASKPDWISLP